MWKTNEKLVRKKEYENVKLTEVCSILLKNCYKSKMNEKKSSYVIAKFINGSKNSGVIKNLQSVSKALKQIS